MIVRLTLACLVALAAAGHAAAGPLWSYQAVNNQTAMPDGATGGFSFPNVDYQPGTASGVFVATPVVSWSVADPTAPDRADALPYTFDFDLRDDASGETAEFLFDGALTGTYWKTGASLTNAFTGTTTRTAELGGNTYTVSLVGFDAPTGYGTEFAGGINARVTVNDAGAPPVDPAPTPDPVPTPDPSAEPATTPEPSTALLALIGLPALARYRRRSR